MSTRFCGGPSVLTAALLTILATSARAGTIESEAVLVVYEDATVPREVAEAAARDAARHLDAIVALVGEEFAPAARVRIHLHGPADPSNRSHYPRVDGAGDVHLYQFGPSAWSHLSPIAHELVHVVRNPHLVARDGFVEEGFASFVAARVDPDAGGFPFFGHAMDVVSAQWMGGDEDLPLAAIRLWHGRLNLRCRLQAYTLRTSFFVELGERFGDARVVEFANAVARTGRVDFDGAFGASFGDLVEGWRAAVWERFVEDPASIAAADAFREAPEIRGIAICSNVDGSGWNPGPGARARGVFTRWKAEVHAADWRADIDRLRGAIAALEELDVDETLEGARHATLGFAWWRLAVSLRGRGAPEDPDALPRALEHLDVARRALPDRAEIFALSATVGGALLRTDPARHGATLGPKVGAWRRRAVELDADASQVLLLGALQQFWTPAAQGGDRDAALTTFERAARAFDALELDAIERSTTWGHAESRAWWADSLLQSGPAHAARAEALYEEALELEPAYWYVRHLQLPQLREGDGDAGS